MRHAIITFLVVTVFASVSLPAQDGTPLLRHPSLSPDGSKVCFSCKGDLWLAPVEGGVAQRLTVHPAEDLHPHFSPDGKMIAFSSERRNNFDVYVMAVEGGQPRRLTWYDGRDIVNGWTPDGDSILFYSWRDLGYDLHTISLNGETPVNLTGGYWERETMGKISPDGQKLIFNDGYTYNRWWKASLSGRHDANILMLDREANGFELTTVVDDKGGDMWPVYDQSAETIYFVANRDSLANIWKIDLASGQQTKVTDFTDDGVQWLNSNPQMTRLVFEQGQALWYLDPEAGQPQEIEVALDSDYKFDPIEYKTFKGDVQEYDVSPDDKLAALIIRGELFLIPTDDPESARQLTETAQREKDVHFGTDSRSLYYASDRNGNYDIFKYDLKTGNETRLTDADAHETKPLPAPDGKKMVFYRGVNDIILYDLDKGRAVDSVSGQFLDLPIESFLEYDFSPDSRWLVMTMAEYTHEPNIYITDFESAPVNISHLYNYNYRPRFSDDGKLIYFTTYMPEDAVTYEVELQHEPQEFTEDKIDSLILDLGKKDEKDKQEDEEAKSEATVIDLDDIHKRAKRAYSLSGSSSEPLLTPDGEKYIFTASLLGKEEIWSVKTEEGDPDLTQLTHSGQGKSHLKVSDDSKYVYYLEGGKLKKLDLGKKKSETLGFSAEMKIVIDEENQQKYEEAWSMLDQYFYDPEHHGIDWEAVRRKYTPLISALETEDEFNQVVSELMGELRASHLRIYPNYKSPDNQVQCAHYGFFFDNDAYRDQGIYKIRLILPNSPAETAQQPLREGDRIITINGVTLGRSTNYFELIAGQTGKKTVFEVIGADGKKRTAEIKGAGFGLIRDLGYQWWIDTRRQIVDSLSDGKLAYVHLDAMGSGNLRDFKQELVNLAEKKDGLVIDVRYNRGGSIAVFLLEILTNQTYIYRNFVGGPLVSENKHRSKALEKPSILIINEASFSNAEIFASGYRQLGLGKIVGMPTSGGVIGTSSFHLIDGTRIRRPSWGCYTADMENLENIPRYPDITVDFDVADEVLDNDPQLMRAVTELLKQLR